MLVADLNRSVINKGTLGWMGRGDYQSIEDVEEGEISDSASVEEISEEDFKKQEARVSNLNSKPRVWTMRDLYKYSNSRNYASGLYNLAWAQAVQNKPLGEVLMEFKPTDDSRSASSTSLSSTDNKNNSISSHSSAKEVNNKVIIDVSGDETDDAKMEDLQEGKEEGELEEGEIDLDSEVVQMVEEGIVNNGNLDRSNAAEANLEGNEIEKQITSIREELETLTVNVDEKLFREDCSRFQNLLDCLWEIFLGNSGLVKDGLIELTFATIRALNSIFCSMSQNQKEHCKEHLLRLLAHVTSQNPRFPPFFSPEQIKEIDIMTTSLGMPAVSLSTGDNDREKERQIFEKMNQDYSIASADLASSKKFVSDSVSVESPHRYVPSAISEPLRSGLGRSRGRGMSLPLLDLHKDHDADSLPSPTRETTQCLPVNNTMPVGNVVTAGEMLKQVLPQPRAALVVENTMMHPYETEALKALSTYQQKFGQSSFFLRDRLPSPTPSEECDDGGGDIVGEISSSSVVCSTNAASATISAQPTVSTISCAPQEKFSSGQGLIAVGNSGGIFGSETKLKAKSRDPRLRLGNSSVCALDLGQRSVTGVNAEPKVDPHRGTIDSRKQKMVEDPVLDGPVHKRQRNGFNDCDSVRDVHTSCGSTGCLEDGGTVGSQLLNRNQMVENAGIVSRKLENVTCSKSGSCVPDVAIGGNEQLPSTITSTTASLHTVLKDIVGNPTVWMNIIKLEQQKSVDPAKIATQPSSSNSILGAVPSTNATPLGALSSTNALPPKSSVIGPRSAGILQTPPFTSTSLQDELGKIRMKPRDPRRILHNNTFQKSVSLGSDHFKTNEPCQANSNSKGVKDHLIAQKQEDQSDRKLVPSQSSCPPDIAPQFTKNLKDIADIIAVSQEPITPEVSQNFPSQPVQVHSSRVEVQGELQSGTGSSSKEVVADPSRSQNTWGDVEHLFEGFDDHQKAAIQKERARRLEEQKKMFAARKLCLVLDLDHTLLNSAKFVEVDPAHDEILRKKEEQDREKPYRHLFRFPHMGMWTKLRPGIWNFLEKASKLFELHLYTMGNRLYATEMAKVLDPKGDLFAGRVISRGDDGDLFDGDERVPKSKDLDGVLGMESSVVIMDDSVRVWPHHKLNLIVVERYIYFPCSRRQFGLPGPSLLEIDHDERPEDGTLASSLAVIERIHQNFFSHHALDEADVRNILASEQRKILGGCRIVFSRVFPVGEANPHLHPLWQMAEQFGAVCTNQIDEHVTHVVANSLGTDKVNWALSTGRYVVHPGWVEASALLYRRASEHDFAIKP